MAVSCRSYVSSYNCIDTTQDVCEALKTKRKICFQNLEYKFELNFKTIYFHNYLSIICHFKLQIRRTVKFLCCLSRGIPIVLPSWLENSKHSGIFTGETSTFIFTLHASLVHFVRLFECLMFPSGLDGRGVGGIGQNLN